MAHDYLIRAILGGGRARLFVLRTTATVGEAQARHGTTPLATAALGRTLTAGLVLGAMLKGEESVTVQIKGDGPLGGIVASANSRGSVKGYVGNPLVDLPLDSAGKLAVGEAVGKGNLHVIRDLGLKEPYAGTVPLQTGEIGDDFAYYFTYSEQVPSAVMLGVLIGTDLVPLGSGGIVVQLLPDAVNDDAFITALEDSIAKMPAISSLFAAQLSPEEIAAQVFAGLELSIIDKMDVAFNCECSKERFERALITLGRQELEQFVRAAEPLETICHFCSKRYFFNVGHLEQLLRELGNPRE
ncbi:MAG TPA: Hsp33 family molecular chaperone HslO [Firmicutes bacterium]|nr:Hsp33 family molecular chaperone HslO [Bacillota bacterium]